MGILKISRCTNVSDETVKYGSWVLPDFGSRVTALARHRSNCTSKLKTRPLVREGATKYQSRSCLKEILWWKKNWSQVPDGRLTPGQTGRLTVGRKLTSTSTSTTGSPDWGSLKSKDNKLCSWVPWDSDLRKAALAMPGKNSKLQTQLFIREGTPHQQTRNCKREREKNKKNWSLVPGGCLIPRRTGRQTVGHNVILTLTLTVTLTTLVTRVEVG
jgi:hypothetical protein